MTEFRSGGAGRKRSFGERNASPASAKRRKQFAKKIPKDNNINKVVKFIT